MARRLRNVRTKKGYRQYCVNCGTLCMTTDFPVYYGTHAFCNKTCYREYYSFGNIARTIGMLIGYPVAVLGPWYALFKVDGYMGWTGLGFLAGCGAFALTCLCVTAPIYKWLHTE